MHSSTKIIVMCCLGFMVGAGPSDAYAQGNQTSLAQRMALSARLHAYGVAHADPLAAMTAAAIRKSVMLTTGEIGTPDSPPGAGKSPLSWKDMLKTASRLANGRSDLEALIDDVRAAKDKGLIPGAIISNAEIGPRGTRRYLDMTFEGGAYAEVYSEGRDLANIDMFVFDEDGELICAETDLSPVSLCSWTPAKTGTFTVVIENKSNTSTWYALITN